jgi:hypothetical protein
MTATICDQHAGDCYDDIEVSDFVSTPDGLGIVRVLHEHSAEVQMAGWPAGAATDTFRYSLDDIHLTGSAAAHKDALDTLGYIERSSR